jgi:hypothetical protein
MTNHYMKLTMNKYHVFPKPKTGRISCEYHLITKGLIIQGHPTDHVFQQ